MDQLEKERIGRKNDGQEYFKESLTKVWTTGEARKPEEELAFDDAEKGIKQENFDKHDRRAAVEAWKVFQIAGLVFLWWSFSATFSTATKETLSDTTAATESKILSTIAVTAVQLAGSAILAIPLLVREKVIDQLFKLGQPLVKIGLLQATANVATNALVVFSSVSTTQAYKASEPIFVVLLLVGLAPDRFRKEVPSNSLVLCLLIICIGAVIAAYKPPFCTVCLLIACISNSAFAARTVLLKSERGETKGKVSMKVIFAVCCIISSLFTLLLITGFSLLMPELTMLALQHALKPGNAWAATSYFLYNLFSYLALDHVSSAAHALLKTGKGLTTMLAAGLFLGEQLTWAKWSGLYIASSGTILFQVGKVNAEGLSRGESFTLLASRLSQVTFLYFLFISLHHGLSIDQSTSFGVQLSVLVQKPPGTPGPGCATNMRRIQRGEFVQWIAPIIGSSGVTMIVDQLNLDNYFAIEGFKALALQSGKRIDFSVCETTLSSESLDSNCTLNEGRAVLFRPTHRIEDFLNKDWKLLNHVAQKSSEANGKVILTPKLSTPSAFTMLSEFLEIENRDVMVFGWSTKSDLESAEKYLSFGLHRFLPDLPFAAPQHFHRRRDCQRTEDVSVLVIWSEKEKETLENLLEILQDKMISYRVQTWPDFTRITDSDPVHGLMSSLNKLCLHQSVLTNIPGVQKLAFSTGVSIGLFSDNHVTSYEKTLCHKTSGWTAKTLTELVQSFQDKRSNEL